MPPYRDLRGNEKVSQESRADIWRKSRGVGKGAKDLRQVCVWYVQRMVRSVEEQKVRDLAKGASHTGSYKACDF